MIAIFGFPSSRGDTLQADPRGSVRKCVAELDRAMEASLEVRIGVNTGEVMTGDTGLGTASSAAIRSRLVSAWSRRRIREKSCSARSLPARRARRPGGRRQSAHAEGEIG